MKIGIIGGSGLEEPGILQDAQEKNVDTPFGKPSSPLITGKISGIDVCIISRHGKKHEIPPTQVNNKANIYALKQEKCKFIVSTTAVGSLREEIKRGDFIVLDQFIDFTKHRDVSFYDKFEFGPIHIPMANPFNEPLKNKLIQACKQLGFFCHEKGTVITIEGNRFSTIAESNMFRSLGADLVNMSIAPECILANEAEIPYATIAMSTDYDSWKSDEPSVTWQQIINVMKDNSERVREVLIKVIESFGQEAELQEIKNSITSIPNWPKLGIIFRDITSLLQNPKVFNKAINILEKRYMDKKIEIIAAIESRGFIFGGALANKINASLVPIRKKGKLPRETVSETYELEYGTDTVEIHKDSIKPGQKVLLLDDLIATGGTALASCLLIEKLGGHIEECAFIIDLPDLKGKDRLFPRKVFTMIGFEGE